DDRELALAIDGKRRRSPLEERECAQRDGVRRVGSAQQVRRTRPRGAHAGRNRIGRLRENLRGGRESYRSGQRVRSGGRRSAGSKRRGGTRTRGARRRIRLNVDLVQHARVPLKLGQRFEYHVVLIQLRVHRVDLALAECVIEGVGDRGGRYTEARRGDAI